MNQVTATGHLGADHIINDVKGKTLIKFSVGNTQKIKDSTGNLVDNTMWYNCSDWRGETKLTEHLVKGAKVLIVGNLVVKHYTKKDGTAGTEYSITISHCEILTFKDGKQNIETPQGQAPTFTNQDQAPYDVPF